MNDVDSFCGNAERKNHNCPHAHVGVGSLRSLQREASSDIVALLARIRVRLRPHTCANSFASSHIGLESIRVGPSRC